MGAVPGGIDGGEFHAVRAVSDEAMDTLSVLESPHDLPLVIYPVEPGMLGSGDIKGLIGDAVVDKAVRRPAGVKTHKRPESLMAVHPGLGGPGDVDGAEVRPIVRESVGNPGSPHHGYIKSRYQARLIDAADISQGGLGNINGVKIHRGGGQYPRRQDRRQH